MTPLCALLAMYASENLLSAESKPSKVTVAIFVEAVNLLWNLCEANSDAVAVFNRENMIGFMLGQLEKDNLDIAVPVMQCIYTVSNGTHCLFECIIRVNLVSLIVIVMTSERPNLPRGPRLIPG